MTSYKPIHTSDYPITSVLIDVLSVSLLPSQDIIEFKDNLHTGSIALIKATDSDIFNGNYDSYVEKSYTDFSPSSAIHINDARDLPELLKGVYVIHGNGFYAQSKDVTYLGNTSIGDIIYHTFEYKTLDAVTKAQVTHRQIAIDLITLRHNKYLTPSFGLVANGILDSDKITSMKIADDKGFRFNALTEAQIEFLLLK